jgi:nanoRNase/pAp phosphatase (c-di-AMP/oligoRNAs hydrolase)
MKGTSTQTDTSYVTVSSILHGLLERKAFKNAQVNIAMLFCVFVCVSVAFKFLNCVTDCYKSSVNIMMSLGGRVGGGGHHDASSFNFLISILTT